MRFPIKGVIWGLLIGVIVLLLLFLAAFSCLPYRVSFPPAGFPWYCYDGFYQTFGYLAFPANLFTNDLSRAVYFAPLPLLLYGLIGFLIGSLREVKRSG